jgi:hypothetical protein
MAFLTLLIVHAITPLTFGPAAVLLAVAMLALNCGVAIFTLRRPWMDVIRGFEESRQGPG